MNNGLCRVLSDMSGVLLNLLEAIRGRAPGWLLDIVDAILHLLQSFT